MSKMNVKSEEIVIFANKVCRTGRWFVRITASDA